MAENKTIKEKKTVKAEKSAEKSYSKMKKAELLELANEKGLAISAKTKKADIIAAIEEAVKAEEEEKKKAAEPERPLTSTERKRKEKADRREAKAARKEANRVEEKKKRPSNLLIAILIFGVLIGMFAFIGGYNYFSKPASIEKYMEENEMSDYYTDIPYDEYSTITIRAEGNTLKMVIKVDEDAPEEHLDEYTSEDGVKELKELGASWLTSIKPETQGFGGTVKVGVKQGDDTIKYIKMSYREAKKFIKELEKEQEEEADEAEEAEEDAGDSEDDAE